MSEVQNTVEQVEAQIVANTVRVGDNKFQAHPESYKPRVFVHNEQDGFYYELLATGEAIPWTKSPAEKGFDFWIIDVQKMNDMGLYRA